jgi:hypothetical protein
MKRLKDYEKGILRDSFFYDQSHKWNLNEGRHLSKA